MQTVSSRGYLHENYRLFHSSDRRDMDFQTHCHDFHKVLLCLSGHVTYIMEGKTYFLRPWDLMIIPEHQIHQSIFDASETYERIILWINDSFLRSFSDDVLCEVFAWPLMSRCGLFRPEAASRGALLEKLTAIEAKYSQIEARLSAPETYEDAALVARLNQEQAELQPLVETFRTFQQAKELGEQAKELMADPEMKELAQEEYLQAQADCQRLERELQLLLLPRDPNDNKSVVMEIRAGVGGEEAALFAHSLYRMYAMYAEHRHWNCEIVSASETELGGVKEITFLIEGGGVWSRLKFESGVHRVQRVPETESGGRVHTSTATVAVLPEMETADVQLNPADIEMQVFRSSGAGGQHVNKTSSAVRLIHKPTGTVVECQQERSQFQNRDKAMRILASRLYEAEQEKITSEYAAQRRLQVGSGMRNERIRTYNFPQGRVTDHRIGLTLYKIDSIMDGDLDELIDALVADHQAELLKENH